MQRRQLPLNGGVDGDENPANMSGALSKKPSGRHGAASTISETRC